MIATVLLLLLAAYLLAGLLFAVPFVLAGVQRIDPQACEATRGFRLMILPGTVLLWPVLLQRWRRAAGPPVEQNAHRRATRTTPAP